MQIFFDLDGTLINSQPRLYQLFCDMCPENNFSYEQYCDIKRQRITQSEMLKKYFQYNDEKIAAFHSKWLEEVESPQRMLADTPFDGIPDLLAELSRNNSLYIVTNRQSREKTLEQIERCGWQEYFSEILVTEQKVDKISLAKQVLLNSKNALWTGDTGEDMKAAKALGIPVIAVSWGVIHPKILKGYHPDFTAATVEELRNIFLSNN